mmetsp:Transcript_7054/g.25093  ORF Transcript_7054/g.25093 Transcript_7054/m.25093 type:complete len:225 (-) Transcript_7054:2223-2897(-)
MRSTFCTSLMRMVLFGKLLIDALTASRARTIGCRSSLYTSSNTLLMVLLTCSAVGSVVSAFAVSLMLRSMRVITRRSSASCITELKLRMLTAVTVKFGSAWYVSRMNSRRDASSSRSAAASAVSPSMPRTTGPPGGPTSCVIEPSSYVVAAALAVSFGTLTRESRSALMAGMPVSLLLRACVRSPISSITTPVASSCALTLSMAAAVLLSVTIASSAREKITVF